MNDVRDCWHCKANTRAENQILCEACLEESIQLIIQDLGIDVFDLPTQVRELEKQLKDQDAYIDELEKILYGIT